MQKSDRFASLFVALQFLPLIRSAAISKTCLGISLTQENYDGLQRSELLPAVLQLIVYVQAG